MTIQHSFEILTTIIRKEKEIIGLWIVRDEVKLSLFAEAMRLCRPQAKKSNEGLLELVRKIGSILGYKINSKSIVFVYTNNAVAEKEFVKSGDS